MLIKNKRGIYHNQEGGKRTVKRWRVRTFLLGNAKLPCSKQILRPTTSARLLLQQTVHVATCYANIYKENIRAHSIDFLFFVLILYTLRQQLLSHLCSLLSHLLSISLSLQLPNLPQHLHQIPPFNPNPFHQNSKESQGHLRGGPSCQPTEEIQPHRTNSRLANETVMLAEERYNHIEPTQYWLTRRLKLPQSTAKGPQKEVERGSRQSRAHKRAHKYSFYLFLIKNRN